MQTSKLICSGMVTLLIIFNVYGCASDRATESGNSGQVTKKLTVIEDPNMNKHREVVVTRVNQYKNISGRGWVSEDTILVAKENRDFAPMKPAGTLPENLYLLNLQTKAERVLRAGAVSQQIGKLSPDKRHVFYKEYNSERYTGYIMNLDGDEKVQVTKNGQPGSVGGQWIDNQRVIIRHERDLYVADIQGKIKNIKTTQEPVFDAFVLGNKLYYNTPNTWHLYVLDLDTQEEQLIKEKVMWIAPSPDQKQLALVKWAGENKLALVLTDLRGKESVEISEGNQIIATCWSPNQTKIAYSKTDANGESGIFVADVETGKSTQVTLDIQATGLFWCPSGKQLLAEGYNNKDNSAKPAAVTYIIELQ